MDRSAALILVFALAFFLSRLVGISTRDAGSFQYDENAYYSAAQRMAGGEQPYKDFLYVHPPGLVLVSASGIWAGLGLPDQRIVHALSGLVLGGIVFLITVRAPNSEPYAPALAVLLLFSSPLYFGTTRVVKTELPATILLAAAILVIMVGRRGYAPLAAMMMVGSSLFRLQALLFAPIILPLIAATEGEKKKAIVSGVRFVLWLIVFAAVCHGALQFVWPRYFENVVATHLLRPRRELRDRYLSVKSVASNLPFALGMLCSILMLSRPYLQSRALAALTVLAVLLTATVSNSLYPHYFLMVLPYVAVCAATVISDVASFYARGITALLMAVLVSAVQVPGCARIITDALWNAERSAELVATIRSLPGGTVLTAQPGFASLGRKRLPRTYYSTDPNGARLVGKFNELIKNSLSESDLIIIDELLMQNIDRENVERIIRSGKPLYFDGPAVRSEWEVKSGRTGPGPRTVEDALRTD
jgi:hypothetical protein